MAASLEITKEQVDEVFKHLDVENKGFIVREKLPIPFFATIPGQLFTLSKLSPWTHSVIR